MTSPQLFGIIPTSCPIITTPTDVPAPNSFLFNLPARPFSHIVVFLLPGVDLPQDTAAAVYLASISNINNKKPEFKFLGGIGPGKESAIFKVSGATPNSDASTSLNGEVDMDAPENQGRAARSLLIGISIESSDSVNAQMAALPAPKGTVPQPYGDATALVQPGTVLVKPQDSLVQKTDALVMAQKIIKNAFNFLASYAGNIPVPGSSGTAGMEVVPLKAFENWWAKFEARVRNDPGFLARDD